MEYDDNPAKILKEICEKMFPQEWLDQDWEDAWEELIEDLERYVPSNDN